MRFARSVAFGFLAIVAVTQGAWADNSSQMRVFNTATCPQRFSCADTDSTALAVIASSCSTQNMGQPASFSDSSPDSNNCLTEKLSSTGQHSSQVTCCVMPAPNQADNCFMHCSYMTN